MRYTKRYNFFVFFLLLVIISSATFFFCYPQFNRVESEKNPDILDFEQEENKPQNPPEDSKVTFNNFNTALRHTYGYLNNTKSYKTFTYGKFSLNIKNLVNIEQAIKIATEVNNKEKSSHTTVCTYGDGKIKNNTGFEFVKVGDEVTVRKSRERVEGGFNYENKDVMKYSLQQYLDEWNLFPEKAFTAFSLSKVLNGNMTRNAGQYVLNFTLERGEIINDSVVFVKRFFDNSENSKQINPSFTNVTVQLTLDEYGRPMKAKYSTKFYDLNLYGVGIPLSGLSGAVSYTQQFYGFGQNIQIERLPDKV